MTIGYQLDALAAAKAAIKTSIEGKGVTVGEAPLAEYAGKIDSITGGGEAPIYDPDPIPWARNPNWLDISDIPPETHDSFSIKLLFAVFPYSNSLNIEAGGYSSGGLSAVVDWGDGVVENINQKNYAISCSHLFDYDSLPDNTPGLPYKQVVVTLTSVKAPNTPNITVRATSGPLNILDFHIAAKSEFSLGFTGTVPLLERIVVSKQNASVHALAATLNCKDMANLCEVRAPGVDLNVGGEAYSGCFSLTTVEAKKIIANTSFNSPSRNFANCFSLKRIPDISIPTNASVITKLHGFAYMFHNCTSLVRSPVVDVTNATSISNIFNGCSNLVEINLVGMSNNVNNIGGAIAGCTSLKAIPEVLDWKNKEIISGLFENTTFNFTGEISLPVATDTSNLFKGCLNVVRITEVNIPNVTNASGMFSGCTRLLEVRTLNAPKCSDISNIFNGCISLTRQPNLIVSSQTNISGAFALCSSLLSLNNIPVTNSRSSSDFMSNTTRLYEADLRPLVSSTPTTANSLFASATNLHKLVTSDAPYEGIRVGMVLSGSMLSGQYLDNALDGLGNLGDSLPQQSVGVNSALVGGANLSKASTKLTLGSKVVTVSSITGIVPGVYCNSFNLNSRTLVPIDANGVFGFPGHEFSDGDLVSLSVGGGGIPLKVMLQVVNSDQANGTFMVARYGETTPILPTSSATASVNFLNEVVSVSGSSVTLKYPIGSTATATAVFRSYPLYKLVMRGYTVAG